MILTVWMGLFQSRTLNTPIHALHFTPLTSEGDVMTDHRFTFMGTGAGCGVPAFFCHCKACEEAREHPEYARGDCGAMVSRSDKSNRILIDTPPDIRHYLNREGIADFDELLYTHWHSDHVGGLLELEYMVQLRTKVQIPTYATQETLHHIWQEFNWMTYCLEPHVLTDYRTHTYDNVTYTALPVHHAQGTVGYLIETDSTRTFYASDTGPLPNDTKERIRGVDNFIMDATYWGACPTDQHHSISQCIEQGLALDAKCIYLTHLCMHYSEPITLFELNDYLKQYNGRVIAAMDGMSFDI